MLSFVRAVPLRRPPPTLTDRLLGVSRRRRQAGYAALAAAYALLRPALRRVADSTALLLFLIAVLALNAHF